jgi:hypothetical protein
MRPTHLLSSCLGLGLCLAVVVLPACSGDDAAPGKAGAAASPAGAAAVDGARVPAIAEVPPPDLGEFRVVSVLLGDALDADHVVRAAGSDFGANATLHASVLSTGAHPGLTLTARWHAPGGQTILETAQAIAPTQPTATTFTLQGEAPWPVGDYVFELLANGHRLQAVPFTVH